MGVVSAAPDAFPQAQSPSFPRTPQLEGGDGPGVWEVGGQECSKLWVPQAEPWDTCRVWAQDLPSRVSGPSPQGAFRTGSSSC